MLYRLYPVPIYVYGPVNTLYSICVYCFLLLITRPSAQNPQSARFTQSAENPQYARFTQSAQDAHSTPNILNLPTNVTCLHELPIDGVAVERRGGCADNFRVISGF